MPTCSLQVLWWATRLTFNSFKIFRHMSRLFYVAGDPDLAQRTLRLYVQIVSKSREAKLAEEENATQDASGAFGAGKDVDTDFNWVQTLVQGSRMLSRLALVQSERGKAVELAKEAGEMLEKAQVRLDHSDPVLVACVKLAEAIWHVATAYTGMLLDILVCSCSHLMTEQDPRTRTKHFDDSLALLHTSLETHPTASTHHHLALAYLRSGPSQDLQTAMEHARAAVEVESGEARHWHLLGLLLTASGDWSAAKEVLEMGASVSEADLAEDEPEIDGLPGDDSALEEVRVHDYAVPPSPQTNGHAINGDAEDASSQHRSGPARLLETHAVELPPSSELLQPFGDRPAPNRPEAFEHALQLRMSQLTLSEHVEGPEGTCDKWVEVFQWFSERRGVGADDRMFSVRLRILDPPLIGALQGVCPLIADDLHKSSVPRRSSQVERSAPQVLTFTCRLPFLQSRRSRNLHLHPMMCRYRSLSHLRPLCRIVLRSRKISSPNRPATIGRAKMAAPRRRTGCVSLSIQLARRVKRCARYSSVGYTRAARALRRSRRRSGTMWAGTTTCT